MPTATMARNGRVTVPVEVRRMLGLAAGVKVDFVFRGQDRVELVPRLGTAGELVGTLKAARHVTLDGMDAGIAAGAVDSAAL